MSPKLTEEELLQGLAGLPREIRPERDPWAKIATRIENMPAGAPGYRRRRNGWLAAAASVVLALAAGVVLKPAWNNDDPSSGITAATDAGSAGPVVPLIAGTADAEYVAAFREFIITGTPDADLSPMTVEKIESGWADLLSTEKALMAALEQNPGDLFLSERMLELRARQLGFLKQLVALDRNNRRMTI